MASLSRVRDTLARMDFHPSRVLGQNFLIDANILRLLLDAAEVTPSDVVLEVGPGLGVVTERLLDRAARVVAIEKDHRLARFLADRFADHAGFELIEADALAVDLGGILARGVDGMVSNLPYSVGSRILIEVVQSAHRPARMAVTVQQEVAERMSASPGSKAYGLLGLWLQADYEVTTVHTVSPSCFWPRPEVKSALVRLVRRQAVVPEHLREPFYALSKHMFEQRRKQVASLADSAPPGLCCGSEAVRARLEEMGLDPRVRPERLDPAHWVGLLM